MHSLRTKSTTDVGNFRLDIQQLGCIIEYAPDLEAREISLKGFRVLVRFQV